MRFWYFLSPSRKPARVLPLLHNDSVNEWRYGFVSVSLHFIPVTHRTETGEENAVVDVIDRLLASPTDPPVREIIPPHPQHSFRALVHDFPSEICGWGAHPEYEIHLIQSSTGSFIAGDYVGAFGPGQVTLMGPNLPHDWVSDLQPGEVVVDRDCVVQFTDAWIRSCVELMPEMQKLNVILEESTRGLMFHGRSAELAAKAIVRIVNTDGPAQLAAMFELFAVFAEAPNYERETLASKWLGRSHDSNETAAVEAGIAYIFDNLTEDIRLSEAARLAYMSEPTFSKFFKRGAGMTFSNMVKKLRIAHARRLLDSTEIPVAQVAAMSGYHNLANFNRQFLSEVGTTPTTYRRLDVAEKPPAEVLSLGIKASVRIEENAVL